MLTFKDIEKENYKNQNNQVLPKDDDERKKKLIKYEVIGGAALIGGFLVYKYVLVKKKTSDSKIAEF